MSKIWKSDGKETKYIEKLFRDGILKSDAKPGKVQDKYPMFNGFSAAVFRKNFGLAKDKCCRNSSTSDFTMEEMYPEQEGIEELDGVDGPPEKMAKLCAQARDSHNTRKVQFVQPPVVPCVFTDPVTKQDKCLVVFMLYSEIQDINIDVIMKDNSSQQTLVVSYKWPTSMYDVLSMFTRDRDGVVLSNNTDPKRLAVEKALQQYREHIEDAPVASIKIELPVEVDMDPDTWDKSCNKKENGGAIIFIELECKRKNYIISKKEKFLKIE